MISGGLTCFMGGPDALIPGEARAGNNCVSVMWRDEMDYDHDRVFCSEAWFISDQETAAMWEAELFVRKNYRYTFVQSHWRHLAAMEKIERETPFAAKVAQYILKGLFGVYP